MSEDSVTIKGETRIEEKDEKGDYYRCEVSRGCFIPTVALPAIGMAACLSCSNNCFFRQITALLIFLIHIDDIVSLIVGLFSGCPHSHRGLSSFLQDSSLLARSFSVCGNMFCKTTK